MAQRTLIALSLQLCLVLWDMPDKSQATLVFQKVYRQKLAFPHRATSHDAFLLAKSQARIPRCSRSRKAQSFHRRSRTGPDELDDNAARRHLRMAGTLASAMDWMPPGVIELRLFHV